MEKNRDMTMELQHYVGLGQKTMENQSGMMQTNVNAKYSEAPYYNVLDLLKRLLCKDDLLQFYCNENQHLKMWMQQNTTCYDINENYDQNGYVKQCTIKDEKGNVHVRQQEYQNAENNLKEKTSELQRIEEKVERLEEKINEINSEHMTLIIATCKMKTEHDERNAEKEK